MKKISGDTKQLITGLLLLLCMPVGGYVLSEIWNYEHRIEKAISRGEYEQARKLVSKIEDQHDQEQVGERVATAQLTYLIGSGNEDIAYRIAQEDGFTTLFFEIYVPKISDIYQKGEKEKILLWLSRVQFENAPNLSTGSYYSGYNEEASAYNTTLEQFISYLCVVAGDTAFARKVVEFVKPTVAEYGKERKLNYEAQKSIKSRYKLY